MPARVPRAGSAIDARSPPLSPPPPTHALCAYEKKHAFQVAAVTKSKSCTRTSSEIHGYVGRWWQKAWGRLDLESGRHSIKERTKRNLSARARDETSADSGGAGNHFFKIVRPYVRRHLPVQAAFEILLRQG
eukprot:2544025-Pleurochrysis_carterae.AAC.2